MCDVVLKFTVSGSVSHLSVLSREQMKKKMLHLLPVVVAPHLQPEGKQTPPPMRKIKILFASFGIC